MNINAQASTPEQIHMFLHCTKCLNELPKGMSPMEWARTQTGVTRSGQIQVWCNRHDCNVALISLNHKES